MTDRTIVCYIECGCCGYFHLPTFQGDCREDHHRFSHNDLDRIHGPKGWDYKSVEDQMWETNND